MRGTRAELSQNLNDRYDARRAERRGWRALLAGVSCNRPQDPRRVDGPAGSAPRGAPRPRRLIARGARGEGRRRGDGENRPARPGDPTSAGPRAANRTRSRSAVQARQRGIATRMATSECRHSCRDSTGAWSPSSASQATSRERIATSGSRLFAMTRDAAPGARDLTAKLAKGRPEF